MRIPLFRGAITTALLAAALAGQSLAATPAAAATGAPDLTVALGATPNPVDQGGTLTYSMLVSNSSTETNCRTINSEPICTILGRAVSGVAATLTLPSGTIFQSYTADHAFACRPDPSGASLACTGGSLAMDDSASIQVRTQPTAAGTFTASAAVDPANAISERSESNNSASVSTTVNQVPLPDLTVTNFSGTTVAPRGGQATYTATITNTGSATATNVALDIVTGSSDWTVVSATGSSGFTPCQWGSGELSLGVLCPAAGHIANLAPGQSATMTIVVQIPAITQPGTYWTVAGADPYNKVRESNESNNLIPRFPTQVV
jgi:CARDB/Domain of unknown function DUF11